MLGFRVLGFGFRAFYGVGFEGFRFRVQDCRVQGFRVQGGVSASAAPEHRGGRAGSQRGRGSLSQDISR